MSQESSQSMQQPIEQKQQPEDEQRAMLSDLAETNPAAFAIIMIWKNVCMQYEEMDAIGMISPDQPKPEASSVEDILNYLDKATAYSEAIPEDGDDTGVICATRKIADLQYMINTSNMSPDAANISKEKINKLRRGIAEIREINKDLVKAKQINYDKNGPNSHIGEMKRQESITACGTKYRKKIEELELVDEVKKYMREQAVRKGLGSRWDEQEKVRQEKVQQEKARQEEKNRQEREQKERTEQEKARQEKDDQETTQNKKEDDCQLM